MLRAFLALICVFSTVISLQASLSVEETIAKARAYVGEEAVLEGIDSIRFTGEFSPSGSDEIGKIDILLKRPYSQLKVVEYGGVVDVTGSTDIEGWKKRYSLDQPEEWAVVVLEVEQLKRARINTWENMNFFKPSKRLRTDIIDEGTTEVDGQTAHILKYMYPGGFYYRRFIDEENGKLLKTENADGLVIIGEDEEVFEGVRIPKTLISYDSEGNVVNSVTFNVIKINEDIDDSEFDMPSFYGTQ